MEIENLFLWKKPESRWEKFKTWAKEEMSPFWANWGDLREGFVYATWVVIGIGYVVSLGFNLWFGEMAVAAARFGMVLWFGLWCLEAYFGRKRKKLVDELLTLSRQMSDAWRRSLQELDEVNKENIKLRRELHKN